jgi:hypothetical protein
VHLASRFIPPTPRLAIDSYWRAHPLRADRLARALAARSGPPSGWTWRLGSSRKAGLPITFRVPPAPYQERAYSRGGGFCCVCGQPVYRFGWHLELWKGSPNKTRTGIAPVSLRGNSGTHLAARPNCCDACKRDWHCVCIAWEFWNAPSTEIRLLRRLQARRCGQTGGRLWSDAEMETTAPVCFGCGSNSEMRPGRSCSISGDCQISRSSIAMLTPQSQPSRRMTDLCTLTERLS